jgi:outer membrane biosynthesis protein TonB
MQLEAIVMRALDRNPDGRYQTAQEFEQDLTRFLYEERILVSHAAVAQLLQRILGPRIDKRRDVIQRIAQALDGQLMVGEIGPHQLEALADLAPMASDPFNITLTNANSRSALGIAARLESHTVAALPLTPTSSRPPEPVAAAEPRNLVWLWISLLGVALIAGSVGVYVSVFHNRPSPIQFLSMQAFGGNGNKAVSTATTDATNGKPAHQRNETLNADNLPVATEPGMTGSLGRGKKATKADEKADGKEPEKGEAKEAEKPEANEKPEAEEPTKPEAAENAPAAEEPEEKPAVEQGINRSAANAALASAAAAARACRSRGDAPTGVGKAAITFTNDGNVVAVSLSSNFNGTAIGACVVAQFRQAHVAPFSGDSVTLFYPFDIPQ